MCLIIVLSYYLFDCKFSTTFNVSAQPHQAESSSSQQFNLFESIRKPVSKSLFFLLGQTITLIRRNRLVHIFSLFFYCFDSPLFFICLLFYFLFPFLLLTFQLLSMLLSYSGLLILFLCLTTQTNLIFAQEQWFFWDTSFDRFLSRHRMAAIALN